MATHRLGAGKVSSKRLVLFDSSFLIAVMENPTPWQKDMLEKLGNYEGVIIGPVYAELGRLAAGKGRASRYASLARGLVESGTLRLATTGGHRADEELVSTALSENALVATIDSGLMEQLWASRIGVVTLRNGRVEFRGVTA